MRFSSSLRESLRLEFDGEDAAGAAGQPWRDHCYIRQGGAVLPSCPPRTARRVCVRESATAADEAFSAQEISFPISLSSCNPFCENLILELNNKSTHQGTPGGITGKYNPAFF